MSNYPSSISDCTVRWKTIDIHDVPLLAVCRRVSEMVTQTVASSPSLSNQQGDYFVKPVCKYSQSSRQLVEPLIHKGQAGRQASV